MPQYNCAKCPGYCCSYPVIPLTKGDVERLAKHFGLNFEAARKKFTKVKAGAVVVTPKAKPAKVIA